MALYLYRSGEAPSTVVDPVHNVVMSLVITSASDRTVDGTLITHNLTIKRRWELTWMWLSKADRDNILSLFIPIGELVFIPPYESTSYNVVPQVVEDELSEFGYSVRVTLEEV
jgi:hypothetical protein